MPPVLVPFDPARLRRVVVVGMGVTGRAVAAGLVRRGTEVVAVDDRGVVDPPAGVEVAAAEELAVLVEGLSPDTDAVAPAPGVPRRHDVYEVAARHRVPVLTELDLGAACTDAPIVGITGTNGKTTVTMLVEGILRGAGRDAVAVGNTDVPLIAEIDRRADADEPSPDVWVVEASSFRLDAAQHFRVDVAVCTNLAPDHLDWHPGLDDYYGAKRRMFELARPGAVAVLPAGDTTVADFATAGPAVPVTFGAVAADWTVDEAGVHGPDGSWPFPFRPHRSLPLDRANGAAAAAAARAVGVDGVDAAAALAAFEGLPHRLRHVGTVDGVRFYDDSKATTPQATIAGVSGFADAVLIAGGRNKGVDLSVLGGLAPRLRAVVTIGEAADEIAAAFSGRVPVYPAADMAAAVQLGRELGRPEGDVVLSPACASFDAYASYVARGEHFTELVAALGTGRVAS